MPSTYQESKVAARRREVAARYVRGEYQSAIANALHITQQQISLDLKAIRAEWLQSTLRDFDALKGEQLAKIDAIELEAWAAWGRSKQPREVTITEASEGTHPSRKATMRKEGQAGDPRFLAEIGKCVDRRCAILGIGAREEALKNAGVGLAALLDEARQHPVLLQSPPLPMAQA